MIREIEKKPLSGLLMFVALFVAAIVIGFGFAGAARDMVPLRIAVWGIAAATWFVMMPGFIIVNPNEAKALQFFGSYVGTVKRPGLWWASPFFTKRTVSLRVRNFETAKLKVNDHGSSPIEIGAVRRKSPARCCAGSRRARSSPRGRSSSKAQSAWSSRRSTICRSARS